MNGFRFTTKATKQKHRRAWLQLKAIQSASTAETVWSKGNYVQRKVPLPEIAHNAARRVTRLRTHRKPTELLRWIAPTASPRATPRASTQLRRAIWQRQGSVKGGKWMDVWYLHMDEPCCHPLPITVLSCRVAFAWEGRTRGEELREKKAQLGGVGIKHAKSGACRPKGVS